MILRFKIFLLGIFGFGGRVYSADIFASSGEGSRTGRSGVAAFSTSALGARGLIVLNKI